MNITNTSPKPFGTSLMIQVSKLKYKNIHNLKWSIASAENIPALDNSFERATMSFGLRNITDRNKSLQEI